MGIMEREAAAEAAELLALRARVAELEAIIAGRTTPPTDEEIAAHGNGRGLWIVRAPDHHPEIVYGERERAFARFTINGARWIAADDEGRPCAWPTAEVSRG